MVLADFAGDPSKSRFRQLDIYMVESASESFRLDPLHRLASFRATHSSAAGLASDARPPAVTVLMLAALQPVMDRVAPAAPAQS